MIVQAILEWFINAAIAVSSVVLPMVPPEVTTVLGDIFGYIQEGMPMIAFFIDIPYCLKLASWFLSFEAVVLVVELIYGVWHKITGNSNSEAYSESNTVEYDGEGRALSQTVKTRRTNTTHRRH